MQTDRFCSSDGFDQSLKCWSGDFHELSADIFQQIASLIRSDGLHKMLFGSSQDALKSNQKQIVDDVASDFFRAASMYSCSNREMPSQTAASISP